jgi:hypothetical protein
LRAILPLRVLCSGSGRYELDVAQPIVLQFTMSFTGSENMRVRGAGPGVLEAKTTVNPFQRRTVAVVEVGAGPCLSRKLKRHDHFLVADWRRNKG